MLRAVPKTITNRREFKSSLKQLRLKSFSVIGFLNLKNSRLYWYSFLLKNKKLGNEFSKIIFTNEKIIALR
jgi:hypothetical protein